MTCVLSILNSDVVEWTGDRVTLDTFYLLSSVLFYFSNFGGALSILDWVSFFFAKPTLLLSCYFIYLKIVQIPVCYRIICMLHFILLVLKPSELIFVQA